MIQSIFTDDMNTCCITGRTGHVERHHVFGAANRTRSTFYHFIAPLDCSIHPNGAYRDDKKCKELTGKTVKQIDLELKQYCQRYYETELKKTREQWIEEFGKSYL